ncbi:MAG TPA: pectinesterase family protein [Ferruginibacter sp.]|nr:pectinesterase family protein [Ferruginibacter sp.]
MKKILLKLVILLITSCSVYGQDLIVAKDGSGNFTTVQAAIDAAPTGRTIPFIIAIKNGKYKEKITIPSNKPFIQLIGESVANTILTYDDYAGKYTACSSTLGTQNSASFSINATDFAAANITFENSFGDGSQAVALLVNADRAVFKNCRFLGNQDTLYIKGSGTPRCYFKSCYIDGNIDFIFGSAVALFDSCVLYAKTRPSTATSYITAPNTPTGQAYGFVFRDARLPMNNGGTLYFLSRPWPSPSEAQTAQKAVFINAAMSNQIHPAGWSVWNGSTITANIYYGEYQSKYFAGPLVDVSARVPWSFQLNQTEADSYTPANMFGAWDPCMVQFGICLPVPTAIAVSNFKLIKGSSSSSISWNISWPLDGIQYELYRSVDGVGYSSIYSVTASNDTAVNFQYTDATVPPAGSSYSYYVVASKAGYASHTTDTLVASNKADMIVNAPATLSLCGFTQVLGSPSASQTYTVTGSNLTGNIDIAPSVNFEVSQDAVQWFNSSTLLSLVPSSGTVATTTVYVRLNAAATGNYTGSILNVTTGDTSVTIPVQGRTVPASVSEVLQNWPLTANTNDDPALRSVAVTASTPTFNNLNTTDGTLPAPAGTVPSYSVQYGQVFGANAAGNNWQTVGGTLRRAYYQQYTVTAAAGKSVKIDSITFYSNFYGTLSGTKMAMVYSKNGFGAPADSTEFSDGIGPTGSALVLSTSGTFTKSFPIGQNNNGPVDYYALALNGTDGVSLNENETLTIRLYWACSSTGTPRYALLKNVSIKGTQISPVPLTLTYFTALYFNKTVQLSFNTANEINMQGFDIERSADGIHFANEGFVTARNGSGQNNYVFVDDDKLQGLLYYRLKMKNRDGSFVYSNINAVHIPRADKLKVVPNLVTDNVNVFHTRAKPGAKVEIYSADGRAMMQAAVVNGAEQTAISAAILPAGMYHLVFVNEGVVEFVKFVKQ